MNQSLERSIKKGSLELNTSVRTGDDEQAADGDQAYLIRLLPVTDALPNRQGHTESHATSRRTLNISMTNYSQLLQLLQLRLLRPILWVPIICDTAWDGDDKKYYKPLTPEIDGEAEDLIEPKLVVDNLTPVCCIL